MTGSPARLDASLEHLEAGRPVLVTGEDHGVVVLPASLASTAWTAWMIRHSSGLLCVALDESRADALRLPPMVPGGSAFAVSVDAATGVTTGISAADRARCARLLADPATRPEDLCRPGHVLPVRVSGDVTPADYGFAAAASDLCRRAGLTPVALFAVVTHDSGPVATAAELRSLGAEHGIGLVDRAAIAAWRFAGTLRKVAGAEVPTRFGPLRAESYVDGRGGVPHLVLFGSRPGPVSVHLECLPGTVLGGWGCRCRADLDAAVEGLHGDGGALVYLRTARPGQHQEMTVTERVLSEALLDKLGQAASLQA
jgi:3,4-dihydroxy 2-butanone 4-phosphate synthase/GTP cyclohydrolase II